MTAAVPAHTPDDADVDAEATTAAAPVPHLVLLDPPERAPLRRIQVLLALMVLPAAVVLTVIAIGLPSDSRLSRPAVELVGSSSYAADRLSASGFDVGPSLGAGSAGNSAAAATAIVYYRAADLALARRVRRSLGRGSILFRPASLSGHDVTVVVGKDLDHIDDDHPPDP